MTSVSQSGKSKEIHFMGANTKLGHLLLCMLLFSISSYGQVKLPKLICDGMVLQRNATVRIWGWASEGEMITVHFIDSTYHTIASKNGDWEVMLSEMKAGGPYALQINAKNSITIHDIVVGDVWVCSGQSNMGLSLGSVSTLYKDEVDHMDNPLIRQFFTFPRTNFKDRDNDYRFGSWQHADSKNVRSLSAAGYFFAKALYEK